MDESIIIVGAGIAGLSTGCYGQMNGYETTIFEMHDKPGGLCTSWQRRGYTFNSCVHWLEGTGPGASSYNRMWHELGVAQGWSIIDLGEFVRVEGRAGKVLTLYTNLDRLEEHLKQLAPRDAGLIDEYIDAARLFTRFDPPIDQTPELRGPLGNLLVRIRVLPFARALARYGRMSVQDFAARISDPFLRRAFSAIWDLPGFPMLAVIGTAAMLHTRSAGYLLGGSLAFARAIERRYLELGGEIHYRARVERILVQDGRAVGVRLADGSEHRAARVVSAADGHSTLFTLLEGRYTSDEIRERFERWLRFRPLVQVSLGVARSFAGQPHAVAYPVQPPLVIAGTVRHYVGYRHCSFDPALAPPGKSVLVTSFPTSYDYWKRLADDGRSYRAEKRRIAVAVISELEQRFPGLADDVEAVDVATPLTYERYTGNWQGAKEGWLLTTQTLGQTIPKTLPGLAGFYMAGRWVEPGGGVAVAALSGRHLVQALCREDRRRFVAARA